MEDREVGEIGRENRVTEEKGQGGRGNMEEGQKGEGNMGTWAELLKAEDVRTHVRAILLRICVCTFECLTGKNKAFL